MKKTAAVLMLLGCFASLAIAKDKAAGAKAEKISGWVSDDKCGAKGANASAAACTKKCEEGGAKLVVVADKGEKIYQVDNQASLKGHEGHHVRVTASDNNGTLHVDNVEMLAAGSPGKGK
jgi:hypothetical protein